MATILLIDDDLAGSRSIAHVLNSEGLAVRFAGDGATALAEIAREPPDLILLDIMMPGMDGYEVVARLKADAATQSIPVIMLTALDDRESKLHALELGAEEFLAKPVDRAELLARVRNLLRLREEIERRQHSEAALQKANAQLRMTNEELEAFAHSVSHDLRRPVRAIEGFAAILGKAALPALDAAGRENLQRIGDAATEMNRLIDDLIRLARVTARELLERRVDLSALARKVAATLQRAEPERAVRLDIQPGMTARGDPGLLLIALTNLLDNAWKFTRGRKDAMIEFGCREEDGAKLFFVRDNGVGFEMRRADKLFHAFRRLHPVAEFPGEGIGLATVRRIVTRHGGRVRAEGAPGKGATFYFTLP